MVGVPLICQIGPDYGYNVKANKTWLVTKLYFQSMAESQSLATTVNVTCDDWPYLGADINILASSLKIRLGSGLLSFFFWLKLQLSRVNHMLLTQHWHMDFPAGGMMCSVYFAWYSWVPTASRGCDPLHSSACSVEDLPTWSMILFMIMIWLLCFLIGEC